MRKKRKQKRKTRYSMTNEAEYIIKWIKSVHKYKDQSISQLTSLNILKVSK